MSSETDGKSARARTILYVDDEQKCCKHFKRIFGADFTVVTAGTGEEALALFEGHCGAIGMVVTDQVMPGMPGTELLARIRESDPAVACILSTAYADSDLVSEAARRGDLDHVVSKPWDLDELRTVLGLAG